MTATSLTRVMIVDDHDLVRSGLRYYIQSVPDFDLVSEASSGEAAVELCRQSPPDIILMDLVMPGIGGIEATRAILQINPNIRVLALTSFSDHQMISDVLRAGAMGYLLKNVSIDELTVAIRNAMAGRPSMAPEALKTLVSQNPVVTQPQDYDLSRRELEVLSLIVTGLNNSEIAQNLSVSRSTIKTHICNIFNKLGVSNRVEAASLALQQHLVDAPKSNHTP